MDLKGRYCRAKSKKSQRGVKIADWIQYEKLPIYYGLAKTFILPSTSEPWGLMVNEAMASGLPILISRQCGYITELCWRGINGYDFDPWNVAELAGLMKLVQSLEDDLTRMAEARTSL